MECEAQHHRQPAIGCQFWLPMKKRCCGWKCKQGEQYCGNHLFAVTGSGEERVPCPANPKHDVPISQLKAHLRKCPEAVRAAESRAQPYFIENLNSGADLNVHQQTVEAASDASTVQPLAQDSAAAAAAVAAEACSSFLKGTAEQRTARAVALGPRWFDELMTKIDAAHAALTAAYPLNRRLLGGCEGDLEELFNFSRQLDPLMPFDKKHAAQHASIVGNMEAAGLLSNPQDSTFIELGAGKGFLSAWLHQVCGASELILLDRHSNFIKKADRRLRHTHLTRVAVDLKDAWLPPLLQLHLWGQPPANAKQREHQQKLATLHKQSQRIHQQHLWHKQHMQQGDVGGDSQQGPPQLLGSKASEGTTVGDSLQLGNGSANRRTARSTVTSTDQPLGQPVVEATHRVGCITKPLKNSSNGGLICCPTEPRGSSHQGQQQMAWVAHGKHLCGAATDFALRACYNAVKADSIAKQQDSNEMDADGTVSDSRCNSRTRFQLRGLAIATCCHHRCGWTAYCAREVLQQYGISRVEFETIAWLTSWALCGHDAAPGAEDGHAEDNTDQLPLQEKLTPVDVDNDQQQPPVSHVIAGAADDAAVAAACNKQPPQQQEQGAYHPADLLDRPSMISLGLKCKQLLDAGRCAWVQETLLTAIQQQDNHCAVQDTGGGPRLGLLVQRVAYIDQSVTGENTLLLLGSDC